MDKTLPIGAVVLLDGAETPLMIVGYLAKGNDGKERDYMGVIYPVGYVSIEEVRAFNKEDIKEVLFNGFENNVLFNKFVEKINAANIQK